MYGSFATIEQRPTLHFERRLAHPLEAVWRAVTEPDELAEWFPSRVEVDLQVGGAMAFTFPEEVGGMTLSGTVTELDPPRRFSFLWGDDHLHFELEPADDGAACVLRFTVELDAREKAARDGAGWHQCLDGLERWLAGSGPTRPSGPDDWRGYYEEYERRGFPTGAPVPGM